MSQRILLALFCFAICVLASDVIQLKPDTFDSVGRHHKNPALIEFFAPWCGHCKKLAPEYEIVASAFRKEKSVRVASVDCDAYPELCQEFDVSGYPTIKWFTPGGNEPYSGGRTAGEMINFINSKTGLNVREPGKAPSNVVSLNAVNFDDVVLNNEKNVFVKFFAPWCGHCKNLEPIYEEFANVFELEDNVVIARVDCDSHKSVCSRFDVGGYPTLKFFGAGRKDSPATYESERSLDALVSFINEEAGTKRLSSGRLDSTVGIIPEFSDLVERFLNSEDKASLLSEVEALTAQIGTKMAKVYKRAFEKSAETPEYIENEAARLARMIASGSLQKSKIDEFVQRINILRQFSQ